MAMKCAGRRKLTQPMTDHILGAIDRDEFMAVVDCKGQRHKIRRDRGAARPGPDDLLLARRPRRIDLLLQMSVHEGALFKRSCHVCSPALSALAPRPAADDVPIRGLLAPGLVAFGRHPPRRLRMIALGAPLAAAMRMVHRVHRDTTHMRTPSQMTVAPGLADRNIFAVEIAHLSDRGATFRLPP